MNQFVVIKGTKSGIIVVLDASIPYDKLKEAFICKFKESASFLGNAQVAVSFEGRSLSNEQEIELVTCISDHSNLDVVCLVNDDAKQEERFAKALDAKMIMEDASTAKIYKGNLRSGQVLEFQTSIIILGDVNVGAQVISTGNVIVLGTLAGNVSAGVAGNTNGFVIALKMDPKQIRIASLIARSPDQDEAFVKNDEGTIAYIEDGNIYIEPLSRTTLGAIRL